MRARHPIPAAALAPFVLLAAVTLTVWLIATARANFDPVSEIWLSTTEVLEYSDITSNFSVPSGDVNFESTINYTPPEWFVATDADVPDGTEVGHLDLQATMGVAVGQGTCNLSLASWFTLYDATTGDACFADTGDMATGTWNGYDLTCAGQGNEERAICEYPCFLDALFPVRPIARYYGHWQGPFPGSDTALNILVFAPGTMLPGGPSGQTEEWGYASVTVLNNAGAAWDDPAPGVLADFCTPLVSNSIIYGENYGFVIRTNPDCADTFTFRTWARGLPDADSDGFENSLDTCPYVTNLGNPKVSDPTGDADLDGLDDACDPTPTENTNFYDHDADVYHNRADNCPLLANNQEDADNDGIGDACDQNPSTVDGTRPEVLFEEPLEITGWPECGWMPTATPTPFPTDSDSDGFSNAVEQYLGTDPLDACPDDPGDDAWPLDVSKDAQLSVVGDVLNFRDRIGATPAAPNWWQRLDFNADGQITVVGDVLMYRDRIGEPCT